MLTEQQIRDLDNINDLLREAYEHYFEYSDGYCKSSEGYVSVSFGNFWDRSTVESADDGLPVEVTICSYVFGPSRNNEYLSTAEALEAVTEWHAAEMATEYDENGDPL